MSTPLTLNSMNRKFRYLIFTAAFFGLGMSMPSCPGQQAMQQQLETLQSGHADAQKKIQGLETQVKAANAEITSMKGVLEQMANTVNAQKAAMDQLNASMTEINTKLTHAKPGAKAAPVKTAGKKKGR